MDDPFACHQLCDMQGFSTGGGAGIDDGFTGLGIEQEADELGAAVLDDPMAFTKAGEFLDRSSAGKTQGGGEIVQDFWGDLGLVKGFEHGV